MAGRSSPEFSATKRLEQDYGRAIKQLLGRFYKPQFGEGIDSWLRRIQGASAVDEATEFLASIMVRWSSANNSRTWRAAAAKATNSGQLYGLLRSELSQQPTGAALTRLVRENAQLISGVPSYAAQHLRNEIVAAQQAGARPETIRKLVNTRFPQLIRNRVNMISRTEPSKASAHLTQARAQHMGLDWYIWRTSEDVRVRKSHEKLDGVLVSYSNPPDPDRLIGKRSSLGHYHAGEAPYCRCTQIVPLSLQDIKFPRRVYWRARIQTMLLNDFRKIASLPS